MPGRHLRRLAVPALALAAAAWGQAQAPGFAPFRQWTAAVRAGDAKALAAFYSTQPPPALIVSTGVISDVPREAMFWAGWKKQGLTRLEIIPILDRPAGSGLRQVGFEAGIHIVSPNGPQDYYTFVEQTWQRQGPAAAPVWRIVSGGRSDLSRLEQPTALTRAIYSKTANAHADIAAALHQAAADHKRVLLVFGGNWCYDCHVLDMAFERSDLAPLLQANYIPVNVDVEDFNYNLDIVKQYGLSIDQGVPMVAVLDAAGRVLVSSSDGSFQAARELGPQQLIAFLTRFKP